MFLCHTKIQETFLNTATDHSSRSLNSDSQKEISRSGGVKKHAVDGRRGENSKTHRLEAFRLFFAGLDAAALETNPPACAANCKVKSLAGGRRSSVKEWEWNAFFSFQHLDSSRLRYAQAQGLKIGERESVFNKSNKRKT